VTGPRAHYRNYLQELRERNKSKETLHKLLEIDRLLQKQLQEAEMSKYENLIKLSPTKMIEEEENGVETRTKS
jgi:hypothetical protein